MFNVGGGEVLVIMVLALVVLGPDKLPGAARTFGKHLGDFRRISGGFRAEIANAMNLESSTPAPATTPAPVAAPASIRAASPEPSPTAAEPEPQPGPAVAVGPGDETGIVAVRTDGPVESFV
jgi:sec-independent protein translocase protein TatB